jgi:hypothetical protein
MLLYGVEEEPAGGLGTEDAEEGEEREAAVEEMERADVEDSFTFAFASEDAREAGEGYVCVFVVPII